MEMEYKLMCSLVSHTAAPAIVPAEGVRPQCVYRFYCQDINATFIPLLPLLQTFVFFFILFLHSVFVALDVAQFSHTETLGPTEGLQCNNTNLPPH